MPEEPIKILGADWPVRPRLYSPPGPPREREACLVCGFPGSDCTPAHHEALKAKE